MQIFAFDLSSELRETDNRKWAHSRLSTCGWGEKQIEWFGTHRIRFGAAFGPSLNGFCQCFNTHRVSGFIFASTSARRSLFHFYAFSSIKRMALDNCAINITRFERHACIYMCVRWMASFVDDGLAIAICVHVFDTHFFSAAIQYQFWD